MLVVTIGAVFLLLAVTAVKTIKAKGVTPYFLAYLFVIGAGFWGFSSATTAITMMLSRPIEAALTVIVGLVSIGVICWGLSTFKRIHEEA